MQKNQFSICFNEKPGEREQIETAKKKLLLREIKFSNTDNRTK